MLGSRLEAVGSLPSPSMVPRSFGPDRPIMSAAAGDTAIPLQHLPRRVLPRTGAQSRAAPFAAASAPKPTGAQSLAAPFLVAPVPPRTVPPKLLLQQAAAEEPRPLVPVPPRTAPPQWLLRHAAADEPRPLVPVPPRTAPPYRLLQQMAVEKSRQGIHMMGPSPSDVPVTWLAQPTGPTPCKARPRNSAAEPTTRSKCGPELAAMMAFYTSLLNQ